MSVSDYIDANARKGESKWSQRLFELKTKADRLRQNMAVGLGNKLERSRRWLRRHMVVTYIIMAIFAWYTFNIITGLIAVLLLLLLLHMLVFRPCLFWSGLPALSICTTGWVSCSVIGCPSN